MTDQGILSLIALTLLGGLLLEIPLAYYSDRLPRARIAVFGAAVWALFGIVTGLSVTVWMLWIARSGSGMGRAVVTPTHNSLLADYYPIEKRTDVYGFHRIGTAVGSFSEIGRPPGLPVTSFNAADFGRRPAIHAAETIENFMTLKIPFRSWSIKAAQRYAATIAFGDLKGVGGTVSSIEALFCRRLRRVTLQTQHLAVQLVVQQSFIAPVRHDVVHLEAHGVLSTFCEAAAVRGEGCAW